VDYSESLQQKILGPNGTARVFSNCFKIADAATKLVTILFTITFTFRMNILNSCSHFKEGFKLRVRWQYLFRVTACTAFLQLQIVNSEKTLYK
jgi:hypothetical protein